MRKGSKAWMVMEESTQLTKLIFRNPKHALDVEGVADANLDMRFRAETGPFIYRLAFHEYSTHGVDSRFHFVISDFM